MSASSIDGGDSTDLRIERLNRDAREARAHAAAPATAVLPALPTAVHANLVFGDENVPPRIAPSMGPQHVPGPSSFAVPPTAAVLNPPNPMTTHIQPGQYSAFSAVREFSGADTSSGESWILQVERMSEFL